VNREILTFVVAHDQAVIDQAREVRPHGVRRHLNTSVIEDAGEICGIDAADLGDHREEIAPFDPANGAACASTCWSAAAPAHQRFFNESQLVLEPRNLRPEAVGEGTTFVFGLSLQPISQGAGRSHTCTLPDRPDASR
jgi:hypothetical protein